MPGGFVGVDVFFVISGFLITALIKRDLKAQKFSFRQFYLRRLRRLGPALLATLAGTLLAGWFILSPVHFEALGHSAIAAVFSVANIYFWQQSGYFDIAGTYKPLLHLWSLGVEEQFYFLWPALFVAIWRCPRGVVVGAVLCLFLSSLIGSVVVTGIDANSAFYLTPFRIFEFAVGASIALLPRWSASTNVKSCVGVGGLAIIAFAILTLDKTSVFPGANALIPTIGTAMAIIAGQQSMSGTFLSLPPLRFVGKISYSLYLVHWPLMVFYTYDNGPPATVMDALALTGLGIILAALMYAAVEQPFRSMPESTQQRSHRPFVIGMLSLAVLICLAGATTEKWGKQTDSVSPEMANFREAIRQGRNDRIAEIRRDTCHYTRDSREGFADRFSECHPTDQTGAIVVFGDSHAADIYMGLKRLYPGRNFVQLTGGGCRLIARPERSHCAELFELSRAWVGANRDRIRGVIYSERAANFLRDNENHNSGLAIGRIAATPQLVQEFFGPGIKVFFWGPRAEFQPPIWQAARDARSPSELNNAFANKDISAFRSIDMALQNTSEALGLTYVSSIRPLCDPDCRTVLIDNRPMIVDYGHWSPHGARTAVRIMLDAYPELENLVDD